MKKDDDCDVGDQRAGYGGMRVGGVSDQRGWLWRMLEIGRRGGEGLIL